VLSGAKEGFGQQLLMQKRVCQNYGALFFEIYFGTPRKRVPSEIEGDNSENSKKVYRPDFHATIAHSKQA